MITALIVLFIYALLLDGPERVDIAVQDGVVDLSGVNMAKAGPVSLDGEWEFYWMKLLKAGDFKSGDLPEPLMAPVPGFWNVLNREGEALPGKGYGTYRLQVKNAGIDQTYAGIHVSPIFTAYRLMIDDSEVGSRGRVGSTAETTVACHQGSTNYFRAPGEDFEVIIQVANFSYPRGGIWSNPYLGTAPAINSFTNTLSFRQVFLFGSLFMIAIFSLTIFYFRRKTPSSLYLAFSCILLIILYDSLNHLMIYDVFQGISFDAVVRIWFLSTVWAPYTIMLFINSIFPTRYSVITNKALGIITLGFTFFYLFFPIRLVGLDIYLGNIIPVLTGGYTVYVAAIAFRNKVRGSVIYLTGLLIGLLAITHDILSLHALINSPFNTLFFYGLFFFTFSLVAAQGLQFIDTTEKAARAELLFLQSQIRPHFIHNALNAIISISRKAPDRARRLLIDFSNYLRSSFNFKDLAQKVPIEQEIDLVKSYVALEKARFGDKLRVNYYIADISFMVPPLILQPLVENAIIHGLRYKEGGGTVNITIRPVRQAVQLLVEDEGVGMDRETIKAVKDPDYRGSSSGLGLGNIEERLLNTYGRGLDTKSSPGEGTVITITIPLEGDQGD